MINKDLQKEAEDLKNLLVEEFKLRPIKLKVKNISRGRAIYQSRFISIPVWAYSWGEHYFYYYIIHEISHFINYDKLNNTGHNDLFKGIEKEILKEWGIIPVYNRAYVKELKADNGDILYKKPGA